MQVDKHQALLHNWHRVEKGNKMENMNDYRANNNNNKSNNKTHDKPPKKIIDNVVARKLVFGHTPNATENIERKTNDD